ncbi:MAG: response regulator transcription factor [Ardenticatenales bacterium]|nr:response regulator transcription factor [Ardenticatenales bacterium]
MAKTVLMVDDQPNIRTLVQMYLEQEGFRVVTAANGREALFLARQERPDLIILDLMMPEMDGYDFIRAHRRERDTPVIMLTARIEENDRVLGLELGADDYVSKPFSPRELAARVRAVLRRLERDTDAGEIIRVGGITLDEPAHRVLVEEQPVDLTPTEFDLLAILMHTPGRAFSRGELLDRLQGGAMEGVERTIDVHVRNLRTKIESDPRQPRYIETVYGIGYRFVTE